VTTNHDWPTTKKNHYLQGLATEKKLKVGGGDHWERTRSKTVGWEPTHSFARTTQRDKKSGTQSLTKIRNSIPVRKNRGGKGKEAKS